MTPAFHNFQYSVPNLCFPLFSLHFTSLKTLWLFSMTLNSLPVQHKTLLFTSMKQFDGTTVKTNKHSYQLRNDLSDRWNYFTPHEETWMYYYVFCHPQIFLTFSMKNHLYNCIEVSSEKKTPTDYCLNQLQIAAGPNPTHRYIFLSLQYHLYFLIKPFWFSHSQVEIWRSICL